MIYDSSYPKTSCRKSSMLVFHPSGGADVVSELASGIEEALLGTSASPTAKGSIG